METPSHLLPKEIADILASTPEVSDVDLARLHKAGEAIRRDPVLQAELQKGLFVNAILNALSIERLTKSEAARRMKCTRQNLNQILSEDSRVNFTIETMSSVTAAVNRRIEISVLSEDEIVRTHKVSEQFQKRPLPGCGAGGENRLR